MIPGVPFRHITTITQVASKKHSPTCVQSANGKLSRRIRVISTSAYMTMLSSPFGKTFLHRFHLSAPIVEKVCEYMSFKAHYEGPGAKEDVSINEFTERIPPEIALELYVDRTFQNQTGADPFPFSLPSCKFPNPIRISIFRFHGSCVPDSWPQTT